MDCGLTQKKPVIFHNLRGYDTHHIIKEIGKHEEKQNVIATGLVKYITFMLGELRKFG